MSNIGLNTNTFRVTGKYLDLLNDFIVRAKVNAQMNEPKKEPILEFINKIVDASTLQPQFQLLSSIIEREFRTRNTNPEVYLNKLKQELEQKETNMESLIPKIQFIVKILDSENSEALAKIKGE
jgi:hypothetical protein